MHDWEDHELLAQFVQKQSNEAFAVLVARHINLVYSAALRQVTNPHDAQDVTQAVFLLLEKAGRLSPRTILPGWLYRAAQLTAANQLRLERRRQQREQEVYMQSLVTETGPEVWEEIVPVLDVAMARLGDGERNAVILRFFEGKSLKEVGSALGATEQVVQKRVERALKKLRGFFTKRGLVLSTMALANAMSVNSVQAAPAGLAQTIAASGMARGAIVSAPVAVLAKSTLKAMVWLKIKAVAKFAVLAAVITGTATVALHAGDYIKRGRIYLFKGDYDHAIVNFNQALALDPRSAPAYFSRGRANKLGGNDDQALHDYTQAIRNNPTAVAAYVNRGQIYNLQGDHDRAIEDFDKALQLDPERPIAHLDRGVAYAAKGDYDRAIADFQSAVKIDPTFSPAYNNLAWQYATCPEASIRDGKKAVAYATKACELSQWTKMNQIETLAAACAEAGDFDAATKWENKILAAPHLAPEDALIARARLALYRSHQPYHRNEAALSSAVSR